MHAPSVPGDVQTAISTLVRQETMPALQGATALALMHAQHAPPDADAAPRWQLAASCAQHHARKWLAQVDVLRLSPPDPSPGMSSFSQSQFVWHVVRLASSSGHYVSAYHQNPF